MQRARLLFGSKAKFTSKRSFHSILGSLIVSHRVQLVPACHQQQPLVNALRVQWNLSLPHQATSFVHTSSSALSSDGIGKPEDANSPVSEASSTSTDPKPSISVDPPATPSVTARLTLSDRCRTRLQTVLDPDEVLRIGVRGGGCSGFEYEFSVDKTSTVKPGEDLLFEEKVVVDTESIEYMNGAQLDYEEELIRSGFRIVNNPLAEKGCSCGASFSLKF